MRNTKPMKPNHFPTAAVLYPFLFNISARVVSFNGRPPAAELVSAPPFKKKNGLERN
jgi:hypothetical protein